MPLLMIIAEWKWLRSKDDIAGALAAGAILLFPSYYYLFRIFKTE